MHASFDVRDLRSRDGGRRLLKQSATRAGITVSAIFALSAVLGFVREAVLAAFFGVSAEYDALIVALIIPMFFLNMLGEASMGAAVVPVFISFVVPQDSREQRRIVGSAFLLLSLVLSALTALGVVFAPQIAHLFAPGFSESQLTLTTGLMRIMLPTVLILGLANFVTGLLHSLKRFGIAASTGVVFNLALVLVTIPLAKELGIVAPAIGVLVGSLLQLGIMVPSLIKERLFPSIGLSFRDPALVRMWKLFWPILAGALLVTALQTIDKVVASYLPAGSLSALSFASKIAGGPPRIFAMSLSVVLFPTLVKKVVDNTKGRGDLVVGGVAMAAFLTLPWLGVIIALRTPVTMVLLQRGAFDAAATAVVAVPLAIYCLSEFASGISTMVNNAFYSHQDSKTPTVIYIAANVLRVGVILALVPTLGYLAIASASAVIMNAELLVLLLVLRRRHMADLDLGSLGIRLTKIIAASVVAGVVGAIAYPPLDALFPATFLGTLVALGISCVPALAAYYGAAMLMRCDETVLLNRRVAELLRRFRRPPHAPLTD